MKKPKYAVSIQAITYAEALQQSLQPCISISFISFSSTAFSGIEPFACWSTYQ